MYPVRPQLHIKSMFFWSFLLGAITLVIEAVLALMAFSHITNKDCSQFPCRIQGLYNANFLALPVIGQITNFYPMLNVAAVPVLTITLRNNLFQLFGLEGRGQISKLKKGMWSFILSVPVIIITLFFRDPQILITYTGGFTGVFILLLIPTLFVQGARRLGLEDVFDKTNFNKSSFRHPFWPYLIYAFSALTLGVLIYGLIQGGSAH